LVPQIIDEAFQLLVNPGIKVQLKEARALLADAGARVDEEREVVQIPEEVARKALETVPHEFYLYNQDGEPSVHYGGDSVHFDPGSSGVNVLDAETMQHRPATTHDLIEVIKTADSLWQYDAQSTALVCSEIPKEIGDLYRLYLVLLFSKKPVVTGAFSTKNTGAMIDMLAIFAGGREALVQKPTAVFDVCPSPPLIWSQFGSQSLIDLARAAIPAQIVSMPLAGAAAPITLLGSVVQHTAECISGMTIHQLANPGSPIVWGGAPAIMDMRHGTTPMGAIETAMIDAAYAQVGKTFSFPTHSYMCASDAKVVDYQAGMESGTTAIFKGEFLKQRLTRQLLKEEQYMPSAVIDRGSIRTWQQMGATDTFTRAKTQLQDLLNAYQSPDLPLEQVTELQKMVSGLAKEAGMDELPEF
jgi:trimethylamine--corrinoid protein Co-methyltransferase